MHSQYTKTKTEGAAAAAAATESKKSSSCSYPEFHFLILRNEIKMLVRVQSSANSILIKTEILTEIS